MASRSQAREVTYDGPIDLTEDLLVFKREPKDGDGVFRRTPQATLYSPHSDANTVVNGKEAAQTLEENMEVSCEQVAQHEGHSEHHQEIHQFV